MNLEEHVLDNEKILKERAKIEMTKVNPHADGVAVFLYRILFFYSLKCYY